MIAIWSRRSAGIERVSLAQAVHASAFHLQLLAEQMIPAGDYHVIWFHVNQLGWADHSILGRSTMYTECPI